MGHGCVGIRAPRVMTQVALLPRTDERDGEKLKGGGGEKPKWEGGCPLSARHTCLLPMSPPKSFSSILTRLELAKILDLL
jgi:hypothetical protein